MWLFNGETLTTVPDSVIGFVYEITNNETGKKYIGKKLFTFGKSKQVKGKRKKIRVESDWKEYYGSNKELLGDIEKYGVDKFNRTILRLCKTKGECSYWEAKLQFDSNALELPELFYNTWIMCRIHRKHLKTGKDK